MKKTTWWKNAALLLLAAVLLLNMLACEGGQGTPSVSDPAPTESMPNDSESQTPPVTGAPPYDLNQYLDTTSDELRLYVASSTDAKQDGFVFIYKDEIWLHDGGENDTTVGSVYRYLCDLRQSLLPSGVSVNDTKYKLKLNVVISHFHSDHVYALINNIIPSKYFSIQTVYCSEMSTYPSTELFRQSGAGSYTDAMNGTGRGGVRKALQRHSPSTEWIEVPFGETKKVTSADGKLTFELFASPWDWGLPEKAQKICNDYYDADPKQSLFNTAVANANSMWMKVVYGERSMLFTGDTMKKLSDSYAPGQDGYVEEAFDVMLAYYAEKCGEHVFEVDLLKYPHHGQNRPKAMRGVVEVIKPAVILFTTVDYQTTTLDKTVHWTRYNGAFCANDNQEGFLVKSNGKTLQICKNSVWKEDAAAEIFDQAGTRTAFTGGVGASTDDNGEGNDNLPLYTIESLAQAFAIKQPTAKVPSANAVIWDGTVASSFSGGSGTKNDPYLIANGAELAYLAQLVNTTGLNTANVTKGKYYKLSADIYLNDVTDIASWIRTPAHIPEGVNVWTPIGGSAAQSADGADHEFSGHFDGDGHTVFGIYTLPSLQYTGLFGMIAGYGAEISSIADILNCGMEGLGAGVRNLTVAYSMVSGAYRVSGIAANGTRAYFYGCTVDPTVTALHISLKPKDGEVGGMVARNIGWIENCVSSARVTGVITMEGNETYYPNFSGGLGAILVGYVGNSANFGDVDVAATGGLFAAYFGGNSIAALVNDCYSEGTLGDMWEACEIPASSRLKITRAGLFTARTAHVKSELGYTVQRCVSAGTYRLDPANVKDFGVVASAAYSVNYVLGMAYVDYGFDASLGITAKWSENDEYLFHSVFSLTPDELAAHRAAVEKEDEEG